MARPGQNPQWPLPARPGEVGITLLEILIVIVMIGILVAVAMPSISSSSAAHQVVEQARKIHSTLATARARAIAEQRDYRFELTTDGEYQLQYLDGADWTPFGGEGQVPENMTCTIDGVTSGTIVFKPHGRVEAAHSIVIEDGEREHEVEVLASGMVRWTGGSQ